MFTVTIDTDNAAFQYGNLGPELCRILQKLGGSISEFFYPADDTERGKLLDINGNTVGHWTLTPEGSTK